MDRHQPPFTVASCHRPSPRNPFLLLPGLRPADIHGMPRWYTVTEVCELLHIRRSTWDKWRARGVAPPRQAAP